MNWMLLRASSVVLSVLLLGSLGTANESLLGLPQPKNPSRPGAVLLHGGGYILDSVVERFVELAGGKSARIVFVPSAGYRISDWPSAKEFHAALEYRYGTWVGLKRKGLVADLMFLTTDNPDDANDHKFVRHLEGATGVWFSGGNQGRLNYRYVGEFPNKTMFQEALLDVVRRGGVVGGTSAGMAAMPEVMTLWTETDEVTEKNSVAAAHGLGLFDRAVVEQHFKTRAGRLERFTSLLRDHDKINRLARRPNAAENMAGIAIEDRSALVLRQNQLEVVGDENTHLFLKSDKGRTVHWHELSPGESAQLIEGPSQTIRLIRK